MFQNLAATTGHRERPVVSWKVTVPFMFKFKFRIFLFREIHNTYNSRRETEICEDLYVLSSCLFHLTQNIPLSWQHMLFDGWVTKAFSLNDLLTIHSTHYEIADIFRQHFQIYFLGWIFIYFVSHFPEVWCSINNTSAMVQTQTRTDDKIVFWHSLLFIIFRCFGWILEYCSSVNYNQK